MATRPVFYVTETNPYVVEEEVEFVFCSGLAQSQKQKSIDNLHQAFQIIHPEMKVLEVSRRSEAEIGTKLSAFNLKYTMKSGEKIPVECVFQSSKVFKNGNHYPYLLHYLPGDAKSFMSARMEDNGELLKFTLEEKDYPLVPQTSFYDWIYISALRDNKNLSSEILDSEYTAFTDIEFNPRKSINCQARTVAIFVLLSKRKILDECIEDYQTFCKIAYPPAKKQTLEDFF